MTASDGATAPRHATAKPSGRKRWLRRGDAAAVPAPIVFDGIEHAYNGVPSIRGVDLVVDPGEIVCLLGPSGCGKTTLLRLAAGLERPTGGRILLSGEEVAGPVTFRPPERRGIGLMFQDYALFPQMTVVGNVMFGLRGLLRGEAEAEARRVLARVGLDRLALEYPDALSGGERQRVALARAIAPRPSVLLMDEPFSGLDSRLRESVRNDTLAVLRETRVTTMLVTHDPEEAMQVADRIALMKLGRVVQYGTPQDLFLRPVDLSAARFFSNVNEVQAVVEHGEAATPLGLFPGRGAPAGPTTVAIRPADIVVAAAGDGARGRVTARRFLGEVDLVEIAVDGMAVPLNARIRRNRFQVGQEVVVQVDPEDVLLFAKIGD